MRLVAAAATLALAACGRIGFSDREGLDAPIDAPAATVDAAPCTGAWGPAVRLEALATPGDDWGPALVDGGLTLYFHSNSGGAADLFVATRPTVDDLFSDPIELTVLDDPAEDDNDPTLPASGARIYYSSKRTAGVSEIYVAERHGPAAFDPPVMVAGLETDSYAPWISADELEMFYGLGDDIHRATRATVTDPWIPVADPAELNSVASDGYMSMTGDERTIYFETNRRGMGEVFTATRASPGGVFSTPAPVDELGGPGIDNSDPDVSDDDGTMVIGSDRPGGAGGADLYLSRRACP